MEVKEVFLLQFDLIEVGGIFLYLLVYMTKKVTGKYLMVFCFYQFIVLIEIGFNKSQSV